MKTREEVCDALIKFASQHPQSYWCKWCNRHLKPQGQAADGGIVFVHDDIYHPADWQPESGDEHILH